VEKEGIKMKLDLQKVLKELDPLLGEECQNGIKACDAPGYRYTEIFSPNHSTYLGEYPESHSILSPGGR
jgi:hypothetical protein